MKQLLARLGLFVFALLVPAGSAPQSTPAQVIDAAHRRIPVAQSLPQGDFELGVYVNFTKPGVVLSNLTLALTKGAYRLLLDPSNHPMFEVWDGGKWIGFRCSKTIGTAAEVPIRVIRRGSECRVEVFNACLASGPLGLPLTRDPIVVGDLPNQGGAAQFMGEVRLLTARAPLAVPRGRVWDPGNQMNTDQKSRIESLLADLQSNGVALGVVLMNLDGDDARRAAVWWDVDMHIAAVPEVSGTLLFGQKQVWTYRRHKDFNPPAATVDLLKQGLETAKGKPTPEKIETVLTTFLEVAAPVKAKTLASGKIGPKGGALSAPEGPSVSVPEGALDKEVNLTIASVGSRYRIETGQASLVFRRPIRLSFPIPADLRGKKLNAAHYLAPNVCLVDPNVTISGDIATVQTNSLSEWAIYHEGRLPIAAGTGIASAVGTGVIILLAAPATPFITAAGAMALVGYAGWKWGDAAHSVSMLRNMEGPLPGHHFEVYWDKNATPMYPGVIAHYQKSTGKLLLITGIERDSQKPEATIGPSSGMVRGLRVMENGIEKEYPVEDVESRIIPIAAFRVLLDLQKARTIYKAMGFNVPESTWVALHPHLGANKSQGKEINAGEWDQKVLSVNTQILGDPSGIPDNARSTIVHEYWHAVTTNAGYSESWSGKEESLATNMESVVLGGLVNPLMGPDFAPPTGIDFMRLHSWISVGPVLRHGINDVGPDEGKSTRGYDLWPWPKYILCEKGLAAYRDFVLDKVPLALLEAWWRDFAHAMTLQELGVKPEIQATYGEMRLRMLTGLEESALFNSPQSAGLKYATAEKGRFDKMSLAWDGVLIPARPQGVGPCPIIVRRTMSHQPARYQGQEFMVGPFYPDRRKPTGFNRQSVREGTSRVEIPASEDKDTDSKRLPIVLYPTSAAMDLTEDGLLVYRLLPPLGFTKKFSSQNTLDLEVLRQKGVGALLPMVHFQGYRLYIRGKDGRDRQVADLLYRHQGGPGGGIAGINPQTHRATVQLPVARNEVTAIGLATIDQGGLPGQQVTLSPITWVKNEIEAPPVVKPKDPPMKGQRRVFVQLSGWGNYDGSFSVWGPSVWCNFTLGSATWPTKIGSGDKWSLTASLGTGGDKEDHRVETTQDADHIIELRWTCKGSGVRVENGKDRKFTFEWEIVLKDIPRDRSEPFVYRSTGIEDPNDHPEIVNPKTRACIVKIFHRIKLDDGRVITMTDIDMTRRGFKFGPFYTAPYILVKYTYGD